MNQISPIFLTNVGTIAAHTVCEFSGILVVGYAPGVKVTKISNFGGFSGRKFPNMGRLGSNWQGVADLRYDLPNLTKSMLWFAPVG